MPAMITLGVSLTMYQSITFIVNSTNYLPSCQTNFVSHSGQTKTNNNNACCDNLVRVTHKVSEHHLPHEQQWLPTIIPNKLCVKFRPNQNKHNNNACCDNLVSVTHKVSEHHLPHEQQWLPTIMPHSHYQLPRVPSWEPPRKIIPSFSNMYQHRKNCEITNLVKHMRIRKPIKRTRQARLHTESYNCFRVWTMLNPCFSFREKLLQTMQHFLHCGLLLFNFETTLFWNLNTRRRMQSFL
jgi:hypothetical protein